MSNRPGDMDEAQIEQLMRRELVWRRNNGFTEDSAQWTASDHERYRRVRWAK